MRDLSVFYNRIKTARTHIGEYQAMIAKGFGKCLSQLLICNSSFGHEYRLCDLGGS